jgi:hypothetical protein
MTATRPANAASQNIIPHPPYPIPIPFPIDVSAPNDVEGFVMRRVSEWRFTEKIGKYVTDVISEWNSGKSLEEVLTLWEEKPQESKVNKRP